MKLYEMSLPGPSQELQPEEIKAILQQVYPNLKSTNKTIENIPLFVADLETNGKFFALVKDKKVLTWLQVVEFRGPFTDNKPTLWIKRSYTPIEYRQRGFSIALYSGLADHGYRIVSDQQVGNPGARQIWNKLEKRGRVRHFDAKTKQFIDNTSADPYNNPTIYHVLEHEDLGIPKLKSSILKDTLFWTHPDVVSGKFKL